MVTACKDAIDIFGAYVDDMMEGCARFFVVQAQLPMHSVARCEYVTLSC